MNLADNTAADHPSRVFLFKDWRFLLVAGLFFLMGLLSLNDVLVYNPDSSRYLVWAKSLSLFKGFEDLSIPEPFHYVVHAPLYSVLLAPSAVLSADNIALAKFFTLLTGVLLLGLFYLWLQRLTRWTFALVGVAVLAVHPLMVLFSNQILSDIPFACVAVLVFMMAGRVPRQPPQNLRDDLILGVLLAMGILLREVGITLFLGTMIFLLSRGDLRRVLVVGSLPLIAYGAWFFRNEILVAGIEFPPLRNSEIFTLRYFTDRDAAFLSELVARLRVNYQIYGDYVLRLLFLPQYGTTPYGVMISTTAPYTLVQPLVPFITVPLGIFSIGLSLYGALSLIRKSLVPAFIAAFIPVYLLLILLYPFNDVRFLFPLLVVMIALSAIGAGSLFRLLGERIGVSGRIIVSAAAIAVIPNILWCMAFVRDNMAYRRSPEQFYEQVVDTSPFPDLMTKPMSRVGEWISARHDEQVIVLTQWKELTFWLPGGKLVELNPLVPLDEFDRFIRDYDVRYVVSAIGLAGIPEFFFQMHMSLQYDFQSEYRVANLEVFSIHPFDSRHGGGITRNPAQVNVRWDRENTMRERFGLGVSLLDAGRADSAVSVLRALADSTKGGSMILFTLAIAHEFAGDFERAKSLLSQLQVMKQSGAFLGHATYHREIIRILEQAVAEQRAGVKAELLYIASMKYWNLGFHNRSLLLLDRALDVSPDFAPSLVFGTYYNLELERWKEARRYYLRLERSASGHPLINPLGRVLAYQDSILKSRQPRIGHVLGLAKAYQDAGLGDSAIRTLLLRSNPDSAHPEALKMLTELYVSKRRYYPALVAVNRLLEVSQDPFALKMHKELLDRW
ncbi:MAG: glycosyltransferase family 39 protein [Bacteroidota bacterium]